MDWKKLLKSSAESANDGLRLRNEYLVAENRILRNQIDGRVQLTDSERQELAEIGTKLGKKALEEIATVAKADTILAWHRKFAEQKVDICKSPKPVGRPRVNREIEDWVLRMARENRSWGYDRIQGALHHLGYTVSDQTVGNILKRNCIPSAPERKKTVTWREFIRFHLDVLLATDFFNHEVWSWFGLATSYLFFFIHLGCLNLCAVGEILQHHVQRIPSLLRGSLDFNIRVQRRMCGDTLSRRYQLLLYDAPFCRYPLSEYTLRDHPDRLIPGRARVVYMPPIHSRQIRDGPVRVPLDELQKHCDREVA
jgi:hypothetical protein